MPSAVQPDPSRPPQAVVLDFGGVLVEIHGRPVLEALLAHAPGTAPEALHGISGWVVHHDYERGRLSTAEFSAAVSARLSRPISEDAFVACWNRIFGAVVLGIEPVLTEIAARAPLYLLSNTNIAHWRHISAAYPFLRHFKQLFTSFELGVRKPEPEVYAAVARQLGLAPASLLFVDDLTENVAAARAAGLAAEVCLNSAAKLRGIMTQYGVLARAAEG